MAGRNFAADYSARLKLRVNGPAGHHDMLLRLGTTSNIGDASTAATDIGALIGPLISNSATIESASFAVVGSNTFNICPTFAPIAGSNGVTYTPGSQAGGYYSAPIFRTTGGSRYPSYFYYANPLYNEGCQFSTSLLPSGWADYIAFIVGDSRFTGIDRERLNTLGHVDVGINDEVTAKLRR